MVERAESGGGVMGGSTLSGREDETLEEYALDWARARCNQGGYLFAWRHADFGRFCHVRRDSFEEVWAFTHHPEWVIVDIESGQVVQSKSLEDVMSSPASPDDIPF